MPTSQNITYVATMTNGDVATRSSRTMAYTHAVQVTRGDRTWVNSWHKSLPNATKAASGFVSGATVHMLTVTGYPYSSAQAKEARAAR